MLLNFEGDNGLAGVEACVERMDFCKLSSFCQGMVRAIAVTGFGQIIELRIYVLPILLGTAKADFFPDDASAIFAAGAGMYGLGIGLVCPGPDLSIQCGNDLARLTITPQTLQ